MKTHNGAVEWQCSVHTDVIDVSDPTAGDQLD